MEVFRPLLFRPNKRRKNRSKRFLSFAVNGLSWCTPSANWQKLPQLLIRRLPHWSNPGKKLDRHYLASRYPDALPEPAIPAESYTEDEAKDAIAIARAIIRLAKRFVG